MKRICTLVGARPQFVKAAIVSQKLEACGVSELLVHSGQHYDNLMSEVFFEELGLKNPAYNLGVGSGSHAVQTGEIMMRLEKILQDTSVEALMVYGDTNSTLAGALVAAKLHIPIFHVEAGLRSFNRNMPEEINRVITDKLSTLLFCPSKTAVQHLRAEGIQTGVYEVGDVMGDILLAQLKFTDAPEQIETEFGLKQRQYVVATLHRAENTDNPIQLQKILGSFAKIKLPILFPMHPRTRKVLQENQIPLPNNVILSAPLSYLKLLGLNRYAKAIFTDSGGLQKEAYWLEVPCFTFRKQTEWIETLSNKWNVLVDTEEALCSFETLFEEYKKPLKQEPLYGAGKASEQIAQIISNY